MAKEAATGGGQELEAMNTTSTPMPRLDATSLVWPIVLILIGILALALPVATSFGVARVLSWLLFFDGIIQFFYAFNKCSTTSARRS